MYKLHQLHYNCAQLVLDIKLQLASSLPCAYYHSMFIRIEARVQLAQGLLDHIDILTGGGSEDSDPFIDLEDLLKLYGLTLPDCRECESNLTCKSANMQVA